VISGPATSVAWAITSASVTRCGCRCSLLRASTKAKPATTSTRSPSSAVQPTRPPKVAEWPAPRPLDVGEVPPFPSAALPPWLRAWVEAQAEALQVPLDLPALISLAVVATASARRVAVHVRPGWLEPTNIFALVALPSGARKSVLFEAATRPVLAFERETARQYEAARGSVGGGEAPMATSARSKQNSASRLRLIIAPQDELDGAPGTTAAITLGASIDTDPPTMSPAMSTSGVAGQHGEGSTVGERSAGEAQLASARPALAALDTSAASESDPTQQSLAQGGATNDSESASPPSPLDPPRPPKRIYVSDVTPERIASLLAENDGRLAVLSDEGEICAIISGRYGGALEVFLKAHSGAPLSIERVGRDLIYVDRSALTLGLAVQPDVLRSLASKRKLHDRGLLARFIVAVPVSNLGFRRVDAPPVPVAVMHRYEASVRNLFAMPSTFDEHGDLVTKELRLSEPARLALVAFEEEVELMLRPEGRLHVIASWAAKLVGAVARVAGLLWTARRVEEEELGDELDLATIEAAISIGRYAIEHALSAFGLAGVDPALAGAKAILDWTKRTGAVELTKRNLQHGLRARFPSATDLDAPMKLLVESGYLRPRLPPATRRPGKQPAPVFDVHPAGIN